MKQDVESLFVDDEHPDSHSLRISTLECTCAIRLGPGIVLEEIQDSLSFIASSPKSSSSTDRFKRVRS